ncbi:MAG: NAD(P)-dependent oxidoreductase, partial [Novosphingobium sp.]
MSNALPLFHLVTGKPVIVVGEGEGGEARRRLVERADGVVSDEKAADARLAFVALAEPEVTAQRLKARGLLVNVMDRPDLCDFTVPSLLTRGPVQIAFGTGGVSAGLAKALRLRIELMLPSTLGALAQALSGARAALRSRFPDAGERRHALDAALVTGGALDPFDPQSADRVEAWLSGADLVPTQLCEIQLRSLDPDDLTLREARLLGTADRIVHSPGVPTEVLDRARADAVRLSAEKAGDISDSPGLTVVI